MNYPLLNASLNDMKDSNIENNLSHNLF